MKPEEQEKVSVSAFRGTCRGMLTEEQTELLNVDLVKKTQAMADYMVAKYSSKNKSSL